MRWKIASYLLALSVFMLVIFQNCQGNSTGPLSVTSLNSESAVEDTYEIYIKTTNSNWSPPEGSMAPVIYGPENSLDNFLNSIQPELGKTITYLSSTCTAYPSERCCTLKLKRNSGALESLQSNVFVEHIEPL